MIHYDLPMSDYLKDPAIGSSHLKHILASPADFIAYRTKPFEDTPATILGTAAHTMILEPDEFTARYAMPEEDWGARNKGEGYKRWNGFKEANEGKICLSYEQSQFIHALDQACDDHRGLCKIIREIGGKSEVAAFTMRENRALDLKARTDWLGNDGIIWDVKTTSKGCSDWDLYKTASFMGYHFQAAHHMHVLRESGADIKGFGWIFVDTDSPSVNIVTRLIPDGLMLFGVNDFKRACDLLAECIENESWPKRYDDDILILREF